VAGLFAAVAVRFAVGVCDLVVAGVEEAGGFVAAGVCCAKALPSNRIPAANVVTAAVKDLCMRYCDTAGKSRQTGLALYQLALYQ